MARVTLTRDYYAGGPVLTAGTELDVTLGEATLLVGDGNARWTASDGPLKVFRNRGSESLFPADVESLADLRAYSFRDTPFRTMIDVLLAGEMTPRRYMVIPKDGAVPDGDSIIEPADYDADANDKILLRFA